MFGVLLAIAVVCASQVECCHRKPETEPKSLSDKCRPPRPGEHLALLSQECVYTWVVCIDDGDRHTVDYWDDVAGMCVHRRTRCRAPIAGTSLSERDGGVCVHTPVQCRPVDPDTNSFVYWDDWTEACVQSYVSSIPDGGPDYTIKCVEGRWVQTRRVSAGETCDGDTGTCGKKHSGPPKCTYLDATKTAALGSAVFEDVDCDDHDPDTFDYCDEGRGGCVHVGTFDNPEFRDRVRCDEFVGGGKKHSTTMRPK